MPHSKTLILNHHQIEQKINRIAYQIYEDNHNEKQIIMAGIETNGFIFAQLLKDKIESISPIQVILQSLKIDKKNPIENKVSLNLSNSQIKNQSIVVVDDVLNSGKTMMYGLQCFLGVPIKKLTTAVLVNRSHKRFPVNANYVGLSLATTLEEHIEVSLEKENYGAYLS